MMEWLTLKVMRTLDYIVNFWMQRQRSRRCILVLHALFDDNRVLLDFGESRSVIDIKDNGLASRKSRRGKFKSQDRDL